MLGSAGKLATAKTPSTAGTTTTAGMKATAEKLTTPGMPNKSREPSNS